MRRFSEEVAKMTIRMEANETLPYEEVYDLLMNAFIELRCLENEVLILKGQQILS